GGVAVFVETLELEGLVVELFELGEIKPKAQSSGRHPVGFAVDDDQISIAARRRIGPPNFEPPLWIFRIQHRCRHLGAVGVDVGEGDVFGIKCHCELEMARILGEGTAAGDRMTRRGWCCYRMVDRRGPMRGACRLRYSPRHRLLDL